MRIKRSRQDDELGVRISLAIVLGMVIGAVAAVWIWSAMSESRAPVMSVRIPGMP